MMVGERVGRVAVSTPGLRTVLVKFDNGIYEKMNNELKLTGVDNELKWYNEQIIKCFDDMDKKKADN